uniref:DedA family protein n=1 Tax=Nitratifractor sp. TaxID=2268144 RepID=UPI0025CCAB31
MNEIQITLSAWADHFGIFVPFLAFFAAFGETLIGLGWLLPGSTILLILGILAGQGVLDFGIVLIAGIVGAFLGDLLNYTLGKRYGSALLGRPWLHLPESAIQKAHDFLDSHGSVSIFLARFIPGLKETVPFLAGSARMDRGKFIFWNLLGAVGWGFEFVGIGYLFSSSLTLAQSMLGRTAAVIGSLAIALIVLWMLMRFLQRSLPILWEILQGMAAGFRRSAPVERFCRRHPRFVAFLADRFRNDRFTGLPLTILTLLSGYILILFGGIVEDFLTRDPIVYLDQIVANLMAQWRTPELIRLFTWITYLGRAPEVAA